MSLEAVLVLILIAAVCGAIGQAIAGYSVGGLLVSTAVGLVGALLGAWIARSLKLPMFFEVTAGGYTFPLVWSVLGAAALVATLGALGGAKRW